MKKRCLRIITELTLIKNVKSLLVKIKEKYRKKVYKKINNTLEFGRCPVGEFVDSITCSSIQLFLS